MKNHNPIDELFNRRLSGHESSVPADMFDRIQSARQKSGTHAVLPAWWMAAAASVLLLAIAFFWGYQKGKNDQAGLSHFPIALEDNAANQTQLKPEKAAVAIQESTFAEGQTDLKEPDYQPAELPSFVPNQLSLPLSNIANEATSTPTVISPAAEVDTWLSELEKDQHIKVAAPTEAVEEMASDQLKLPEFTKLAILDFRPEGDTQEASLLASLSNSPKCAKFGMRSWQFDLDMLAGPAYGFHTLEDGNLETSEHLKRRQNTEQPTTSFGTQIRLSALSPSGMAVRTGLAFTQLNTRFEYHNENEHIIRYVDQLGPNGEVIRTDTIHSVGARHMVDHNRFRFLEVPLQLGYEFRSGKLKMAVNAGASLNLLFAAKGTFISPATGAPTSFASSNTESLNTIPAYRTQIGASLDASITLRYHLVGRYSLLIEPYFRHYTGSLTEQAYSLRHQASVSGLNLGLRMRL